MWGHKPSELCLLGGDPHDVVHCLPGHRPPALGNEQPGQLVGEVALDGAQLVASDRMLHRKRVLEPLHPQPGSVSV